MRVCVCVIGRGVPISDYNIICSSVTANTSTWLYTIAVYTMYVKQKIALYNLFLVIRPIMYHTSGNLAIVIFVLLHVSTAIKCHKPLFLGPLINAAILGCTSPWRHLLMFSNVCTIRERLSLRVSKNGQVMIASNQLYW